MAASATLDPAAPPQPLRVLVVDDHRSVAVALGIALDATPGMACVGTAGTADEALRQVDEHHPDVVLMDAYLPGESGVTATRRVLGAAPDTVVVMLTGHPDPDLLARAAQAGAAGFLSKEADFSEVAAAIREARDGAMLITSDSLAGLIASATGRSSEARRALPTPLTRREEEVLALLASGHDLTAIAKSLGIAVQTTRGHVKNLLVKLDAHSQLQAVVFAARLGLFSPDHPLSSGPDPQPPTP